MKLSSREQNWSKSDKYNILSLTILTSSSPVPSARITTQVFMQHWTISSHPSPVKCSPPNAVECQLLWSWRCMLKWDLLGSTSSFSATTSFNIIHSHYTHYSHWLSCWKGQFFLLGAWEGQFCISQSASYQKVTETRCYILSYTRWLLFYLFVRAFHTHLPDLFPSWRLNMFEWVNPGKHFKHLPCFWLNAEQCYGWAVAR